MAISKFLDPKNDFAFKRIFGTEKNKDILIHFLNDMLDVFAHDKVQTVTFLKTIQDPDIAAKKQSIVDVLCVDQKGRQYIVEMQVAHRLGFEKRAQYYAAKAYVTQMNEGDEYHKLKEIIFLAITDYIMFPDKPEYKSDHVILDKNSYTRDLKDFSFTFLELPKFTKSIDEITTMVDKWAYFFKHADETSEKELEQISGPDIVIRQAYDILNQYNWTPEELRTYEQELKNERDTQAILAYAEQKGKAEGKAEGLEQGRAEKKETQLQIARNLRSRGLSIQEIIAITGLSEKDIRSL